MSRMNEMSHAMQDYCNENYGPEDIHADDDEVDRIMTMSEDELRAELAAEGKTMEGVAAEMRQIFERAKVEADMRLAIRAWLKCPAEKRPSAQALGERIASIASAQEVP